MFGRFNRPPFAFESYGSAPSEHERGFPWMRPEHHSHHHEHHHGPHFRMHMGRGFFGPGGPFGGEGFFEGRRFFGRGDLKYALLELLQERPMHGYEMMKALEERSGGFYVASAGSIYPTLQMLEDRGLVTSAQTNGKKVYSITDAGRAFLGEHNKEEAPQWRGFGPGGKRWNNPELHALRGEAAEVARLFVIAGRASFRDPEKLARLRSVLEHTRKDLSDLIYGSEGEQSKAGEQAKQSGSTDTPPTSEQA